MQKALQRRFTLLTLLALAAPSAGSAALVQYGFDFTSGTVAENGGTVTNDGTGSFTAAGFKGDGGTYSDDIPPAASRQFTTGVGSLNVATGAIRTGTGAFSGQAVATNSDITAAGGLTLEAWVKGGNNGIVLTIAGAFAIMGADDGYRMVNGASIVSESVFSPADRTGWTHVAAVYSEPVQSGNNLTVEMMLFINGALAGQKTTTLPFDLARGLGVGDHPIFPNGADGFNGFVYEPRISLGVLPPSSFTVVSVAGDLDTDGDGIPDAYELANGLDINVKDHLGDLDQDGLNNLAEYKAGTRANSADSDSDGLADGAETNTGIYVSAANTGSDPLKADTDSDGFKDGMEVAGGFDPTMASSTPESVATILAAVEFRFNAAASVSYRIEGSTDLQSWTVVEDGITGAGNPVSRLYPTASTPVRFFRAVRN